MSQIIVRNWVDGREYGVDSLEDFQRVYGADPAWYIAAPPELADPTWVALHQPAEPAVAAVLEDGAVGDAAPAAE